ncbi:MAG: hypothetical protein J7K00_01080 [Candidatus Diapherotrites archaeon]|nr:hypothetical protein [Candidatus Diapherotrites archaeon]
MHNNTTPENKELQKAEKTPRETYKAWQKWQKYFKEKLYRQPASSHEDYYNLAILTARSPQQAIAMIRKAQRIDPSSMGIDLAEDFRLLYNRTEHDYERQHISALR